MKKWISLLLCIALLTISSCVGRTSDADATALAVESFLLLGLDDAAENSDVIAIVSYHHAEHRLSFLQIPRDTYYEFSSGQNKLNQLYATYRQTQSKEDATRRVAEELSRLFGIPLVGYVAITTRGLRSAVDAIGGVDLSLPEDITVYDEYGENPMHLSKGTHHLDGARSERFVRFRRGYAMGDLGRLDAQKIFFSALLSKVRDGVRFEQIPPILMALRGEIVMGGEGMRLTPESFRLFSRISGASISYITMPGESTTGQTGVSYYVINRRCAMDVLTRYLCAERSAFDPNERLYKKNETSFRNIYFDKNMGYREYTEDNLGSLHIPGAN